MTATLIRQKTLKQSHLLSKHVAKIFVPVDVTAIDDIPWGRPKDWKLLDTEYGVGISEKL